MAASGYTGNPPGSGGGGGGAVDSVNGRTGAVVLSRSDVQLPLVDNTPDSLKPVSTPQATALALKADTSTVTASLALKAPLASPTFTGTVSGVSAAMVGLGSVNNTADTAKPVSTAQAAAIALKSDLVSPTFTGTPAVPTAAPGTNTTQAASTAYVTAAVAAGGGGGGGTALKVRNRIETGGNIVPQASGSWAAVTGSPTISLTAAAGDFVSLEVLGSLIKAPSNNFLELAVLSGGVPVRYGSNNTATPSTEGDPALYSDFNFRTLGWGMGFVAQAGDISGGVITFGFATKGAGTGTTIYASTDYPLRWRIMNYGAVTVS